MNIKFIVAFVVLTASMLIVSSYDFAGHEWGCSFSRMCNASDVYRCDDRQCIDFICEMLLKSNTVDWTMIQPWPEMKQSCTWKNYGHEPTSNMTLIGVNLDGAMITDKYYCHTVDGCLEILCNLALHPDIYRMYVIADRKKCMSLGKL